MFALAVEYTNYLSHAAETNFGLTLFRVDVNGSLESTTRFLNNIFYKRVYVINDYIEEGHAERKEEQRLLFLNFCARTNTAFVDVNEILKTNYWQKVQPLHDQVQSEFAMRWTAQSPQFSSNYSPKLIINAITNYLKSLKVESR